jgi:CRP/FNR family transcriptional regulator
MSIACTFEKYFPFWKELSEKDRAYLCENTAEEHYDRGAPVQSTGGCSGLFLVRSGRLRVYMLSEEGKEITLYRLEAGDVCMLAASCVLGSITFDVFVDAELPSDCYRIGASAFGDVVERIPSVKIFALETTVERFSEVMWVMQQLVFMSMDERLAIFLLEESRLAGSETLSLTHEQIARHLGTAREVVTRVLKHMASDGLLEVLRGGIKIKDKSALRRLAQ